ncbi:MAG: histidine phosphatase family protein [Patescibacteria group bacterium]
MTKRFYIIRHGEKLRIPGDPPLSQTGNRQALLAAKYLKSIPISKIVASPLLRTQQTAMHIADLLGLKVETNELLKERMNWGSDPAQTFPNFLKEWRRGSHDREWQPPTGDSSLRSGERLEKIIREYLQSEHEHIVLVTHGGITTDFLRNQDFDVTLDVNIKECSITIIEADLSVGKTRLIALASIDHLKE